VRGWKKKKYTSFIILLLLGFVLSGCSTINASQEVGTKEFKIAHVTQESHIWHQTAVKFGEELEKLSDGRFTVNLYPSSQLGQEKDYMLLL